METNELHPGARHQRCREQAEARLSAAKAEGLAAVAINPESLAAINRALRNAAMDAWAASRAMHRAGLHGHPAIARIEALARQAEALQQAMAVEMYL